MEQTSASTIKRQVGEQVSEQTAERARSLVWDQVLVWGWDQVCGQARLQVCEQAKEDTDGAKRA